MKQFINLSMTVTLVALLLCSVSVFGQQKSNLSDKEQRRTVRQTQPALIKIPQKSNQQQASQVVFTEVKHISIQKTKETQAIDIIKALENPTGRLSTQGIQDLKSKLNTLLKTTHLQTEMHQKALQILK